MATGFQSSTRGLKGRASLAITALLAILVATLPFAAGSADAAAAQNATIATDPDLRIAIIGDSGVRAESKLVLEMIDDQNVDMVLHVGDFDYRDNPALFKSTLDEYLGADMPIFAVVGNHDIDEWPTYQQDFQDRLDATSGASCTGDYGVNASCTYRGLSFVLSGVGTLGSGHESFLSSALSNNDHLWRICMFHKNQRKLQVGTKPNAVGWNVYETCRQNGAIILTGHEHSYGRTKTLIDMSSQAIDPAWPLPDNLRVGPGASFTVQQGLGGRPIRPQGRCLPASPPYGCNGEWASILSTTNNGNYGALFLDLGINGDPTKGRGTFIDVNGQVLDTFDITSENGDVVTPTPSLYYSIGGGTTLPDGTRIANDDIVEVGPNGPTRYFDGSDVGISALRTDAFAILDDGDLLMSFTASGTVPGVGTVDDSDIVRFTPTTLGDATSGSFSLYFDGSDVGLTTSGEDIDALDVLSDGTIVVSTAGQTVVPGVTPRDEDLMAFSPVQLGDTTAGTWSLYFDGSDAGVKSEDIDGASVNGDTVSLSFKSGWSVDGISGADEDVVDFAASDLGPATAGSFVGPLLYDGSTGGLGSTDIDALHIP